VTSLFQWFSSLDSSTKASWIGGLGAVAAAAGTLAAAWYTKRAANEAAKAAKTAADQMELQRPRPIVVPEFQYSFAVNRGNMASANYPDFHLRNIGDSPAFDVELSTLEVSVSRLETNRLPYLLTGTPVPCIHQLRPQRGLSGVMGSGALFVVDAKTFFDQQRPPAPGFRHEVPFSVSYRALDGRRFEQPCLLVVHFPSLSAWVETVSSLLETATLESE
jgi:hypothetical protein